MNLRTILILVAVLAFVALGLLDLTHGSYRTGSASIMLALANLLLLGV